MSDEERTAKDLMTAEESAEFDIWMAIETSLEDLEVALYLAAWSGPVYKTVQQQAEMDDDDEESVAYKHADRGRSREKAEDAINRLHDLIERIGEAGSVRNFLDGKKE